MVHILLASHGTMAAGMEKAISILMGKTDGLSVINCYVDASNVNDAFREYFSSVPETEQVIMLSDLYGGSVNQIMYQWLTRPHTKLIAGINLALLLEMMAIRESTDEFSDEQLVELTASSREAMRFVTLEETEAQDTSEDFF